MRKRRRWPIALVVLSLAVLVAAPFLSAPLGWRTRLVAWKLRGALPEMTWTELYRAVQPGNASLQPSTLF